VPESARGDGAIQRGETGILGEVRQVQRLGRDVEANGASYPGDFKDGDRRLAGERAIVTATT
jgi:hypothetical protein